MCTDVHGRPDAVPASLPYSETDVGSVAYCSDALARVEFMPEDVGMVSIERMSQIYNTCRHSKFTKRIPHLPFIG